MTGSWHGPISKRPSRVGGLNVQALYWLYCLQHSGGLVYEIVCESGAWFTSFRLIFSRAGGHPRMAEVQRSKILCCWKFTWLTRKPHSTNHQIFRQIEKWQWIPNTKLFWTYLRFTWLSEQSIISMLKTMICRRVGGTPAHRRNATFDDPGMLKIHLVDLEASFYQPSNFQTDWEMTTDFQIQNRCELISGIPDFLSYNEPKTKIGSCLSQHHPNISRGV